ncbi:hypothetical protein, partial [Caldovatus aquaticus]
MRGTGPRRSTKARRPGAAPAAASLAALALLLAAPAARAQPAAAAPPSVLLRLAAEARDLALLCREVPAAGAAAGAGRWRGAAAEGPALDTLARRFGAAAERGLAALAARDPEA